MKLFHSPRIVLAACFALAVAAASLAPAGQASPGQQPAAAADEASRFTGKSTALDATGLRATRRRFEAGARSAWHSHERGQLLFVEEGRGRVQRRGGEMKEIGTGESDYTAPNLPHWHGAVPDQPMVQSALSFGGETRWMEQVTDAEYRGTAARQQPAAAAAQAPAGRGRGPQGPPVGLPRLPLGDGPFVLDTAEQHKIRVVVVTKGLANPWSLAFLPGGDVLVTERAGRLRVIRNGVLDPQPVAGMPKVYNVRLTGLMDLALHPRFAENKLIYFTYSKPGDAAHSGLVVTALARGRWDGRALTDVRDLLLAEPWWDGAGGAASRIGFGRDGMLYMTTGASNGGDAQKLDTYRGKVLRVKDDGSVPSDNPYVNRAGAKPEVYSFGHRNQLGLAFHPDTGALWTNENGPNGGDEINVILPGRNYGWPEVSYGRSYEGPWQGKFWRQDVEQPLLYWVPAIAASGMAFYTSDRIPAWKGHVFVGALRKGEIPGTGHLQRIVFNANGEELRREELLTELRQRIRDVRQGPDGLLYLLTDEADGALLRIESAP